MTKPYSDQQIEDFLKSVFPTYEDLMAKHMGAVMSIRKRKNPEQNKRLDEILRYAMINSVRDLEESIGDEIESTQYIQRNYPGLYKTALKLYSGKISPWFLLLLDFGRKLKKKPARNIDRTLKELLEEIDSLGEDLESFRTDTVYKRDPSLVGAAHRLVGNFGKAVILTGRDYPSLKRVQKSKHGFEHGELPSLASDRSLSYRDKVACIFNAFALQYYGQEAEGRMRRNREDLEGNLICSQESFFDEPSIYISFLQRNGGNPRFSVSISLEGAVNTFYRQNFSFHSKQRMKEADFAVDFFHYLATSMKVLDQNLHPPRPELPAPDSSGPRVTTP